MELAIGDYRSASEQLVDLHVFVIPRRFWRCDVQWAYNAACLEAISVGFIRVEPEINLQDLREEIEDQLEDQAIPESFVFLRTLGRCLAMVSDTQEMSLKAKYYVPPYSPCPEIFLLPYNQNVESSPSMSVSRLDISGNQRVLQQEEGYTDSNSTGYQKHYPQENRQDKLRTKRQGKRHDMHPTTGTNTSKQPLKATSHTSPSQSSERQLVQSSGRQQSPVPEKDSRTKDEELQQSNIPQQPANKSAGLDGHVPLVVRVQHPSDSSTDVAITTGGTRQAHVSGRIQNEAPERDGRSKSHSRHSKSPVANSLDIENGWEIRSTSSNSSYAPYPHVLEADESSVLDKTHLQAVTAQFEAAMFGDSDSSAVSRNAADNESMSGRSRDMQTSSKDHKVHSDYTGGINGERSGRQSKIIASKIKPVVQKGGVESTKTASSSNRNLKPGGRGTDKTISNKQLRTAFAATDTEQKTLADKKDNHKKLADRKEIQNDQKKPTDGREAQGDPRSSRDFGDSNLRPTETNGMSSTSREDRRATAQLHHHRQQPVIPHNKQSVAPANTTANKSSRQTSKQKDAGKGKAKIVKENSGQGSEYLKVPPNHGRTPVDHGKIQADRGKTQADRGKTPVDHDRNTVVHEASKQESVARKKSTEEDRLTAELQTLQQSRFRLEQDHTRLVSEAKVLQVKSKKHRQKTESAWKKKYLSEKKRTPQLEHQCEKLRQQLHVVLAQNRGEKQAAKGQKSFAPGSKAPSQTNNMKIQCANVKDNLAELRHKVEQAKARLTAECQTRERLETEVKTLRQELVQKKINLSLIQARVH